MNTIFLFILLLVHPSEVHTIQRENISVTITNIGGRIMQLLVPDRDGNMRDVVLGFDRPTQYLRDSSQTDFGAAIGRYANRIAKGELSIDEQVYQLPQNNFGHCLHGGTTGWQYQYYQFVETAEDHVKLSILSPDGDNGFPGEVTAYVTYSLIGKGQLRIDYEATTTKPTVINLTNHSYFNLSGDPHHEVTQDQLRVAAKGYTPVDDTFIPTAYSAPVAATAFDFRTLRTINSDYDHNFVLSTQGKLTREAACLYCPLTGILMRCYTTEPGIQVYTGNFLDGTLVGKGGIAYQKHAGICLETQHCPDSPHHPDWPSTILRPNETYRSTTIYQFLTK